MRNSIKAVEKKRAYEDIVMQIRDLIVNGTMKRGDQLPPEYELCEMFKVSRPTIREALRTLATHKLVESRHGDGTYILASSEEALIRPLADALFHQDHDEMHEIFYIRSIVEPYIAAIAAKSASPEEIEELTALIHEQQEAIAAGKNTAEYVPAFHERVVRMSKNRVLERLLLALLDISRQSDREYLQNEQRLKKSFEGHCNIFAAIKARDSTAARRAMQRHLDEVERITLTEGGEGKPP
jgi:GntR family transcriptional regulator, transcriptional repressor for pyruvate dehydrogenase complex